MFQVDKLWLGRYRDNGKTLRVQVTSPLLQCSSFSFAGREMLAHLNMKQNTFILTPNLASAEYCPPAIIMKNIGQKKLPSPSLAAGQPLPYISAIPPLFRRGDRPLYIKPGERWSTLSYHGGGKDQIFHLSRSYEFHFIHMLIKLLINKMNDMLFRPLVSPGMEGMLIHIPKPGKP